MAKQRKHLVRVNPEQKWRAGERERPPGHDIDFVDFDRAPANDNGGSALALRIFLLLLALGGLFVIGSSVFLAN